MRRVAVMMVVALAACLPGEADPPDRAAPSPSDIRPSQPAGGLPAAEPQVPSLAAFRARAAAACASANDLITGVPLQGDPLHPDARQRDVRAAIDHFATASRAWAAAANDLWDFGLPRQVVGQKLISALDTLAQYHHQTAELLRGADRAGAQAAVGAADDAARQADRLAVRLGIGRLRECGTPARTLPRAQRVEVTAEDFAFSLGQVSRGATRFVVDNAGSEPHQLVVVRLREAGTLDDAVAADREHGTPGAFLRGRAGVSPVVDPGRRATLDVRLQGGAYGLLCFVASEDGTPHAYKGMATEIVVDR